MSFEVRADGWMSELLGVPAFRVVGGGDATAVERHVAGQAHAFYDTKVATDRIDDVRALARLGFAVVDTNVTFEQVREVPFDAPGVTVGELAPGEEDAVLDIAGSAFRYSRFHLDPSIDDAIAHRIKREWIRNYVRRVRGDRLFVARLDGRPAGFLAALIADGHAVLDLIGVANDAQRRGVGGALTAAFAAHYRAMPRLVGTQVANVPSVRLYTRLGFELAKSQYVLHHHVGA